ncbi:MAG: hypothetical protein EHM41_09975 [Chloroflexi bacterium]|nr:MAG: hypothetical protein EHM41_09975 [Chloroflexota bacterium]
MKKFSLIFGLILVFSLLVAACAPADDGTNGTPGAEGELPETGGLADDDTVGMTVMGSDGAQIGTVEDEIDAMGREYTVLNYNGQFVPVPSEALISEGDQVTFAGDMAMLDAAPSFASAGEIDPESDAFLDVETYWAGAGY